MNSGLAGRRGVRQRRFGLEQQDEGLLQLVRLDRCSLSCKGSAGLARSASRLKRSVLPPILGVRSARHRDDSHRFNSNTHTPKGATRIESPIVPQGPTAEHRRVAGLAGHGRDGEAAMDEEQAQRPVGEVGRAAHVGDHGAGGRVAPSGRGEEVALGNNLDLCFFISSLRGGWVWNLGVVIA